MEYASGLRKRGPMTGSGVTRLFVVGKSADYARALRANRLSESGSSLERLARGLIGAVERRPGFRQDVHQRGP
jgi:hypothetical protein